MPKGLTFANDELLYVFQATSPSWASNTYFYFALHTSDPTSSGSQTSGEVTVGAYPAYARVAVIRTSAGLTVASNGVQNAALVQFPICTAGGTSPVCTNWSLGTAANGAGEIVYTGTLVAPITVNTGIQPQFAAGVLTATET